MDEYYVGKTTTEALINEDILEAFYEYMRNGILNEPRPNNIGKGTWAKQVDADLKWVDDVLGANSKIAKAVDALGTIGVIIDVGVGIYVATEIIEINGKSAVDWVKEGVDWLADGIAGWLK